MSTPQKKRPLDDQDLARLLCGSTDPCERTRLLARLAADPDAREILAMALEALEVAAEARKESGKQAA